MSESAPAFSFYAKDFMLGTVTMSLAERGAYITLLAYQWDRGNVPDGAGALGRICGCSAPQAAKFWTVVRRKFVKGEDGLWRNLRLEQERQRQADRRAALAANGRLGGRPPRAKTETYSFPKPEPKGNQNQSLPSPVPDPDPSPDPGSVDRSPDVPPAPVLSSPRPAPDARSKHPVFKGERFVVFEWQLDDLRKMLGTHFNAFDIHSWFYELEARVTREGLVIPPRDGGVWLAAQTLAEAQKRGLPIATTTAPNALHQSMFGPGTSSAELAAGAKRVLAERGK